MSIFFGFVLFMALGLSASSSAQLPKEGIKPRTEEEDSGKQDSNSKKSSAAPPQTTSPAQPPKAGGSKSRVEEEDDPGKSEPAKKTTPKASPKPATTANSGSKNDFPAALAEDARTRKLPLEIQNFYNRLSVPFDILTTAFPINHEIVPLPYRELQGEKVQYTRLINGQPEKDYMLDTANVASLRSYEEIAFGSKRDNFTYCRG
jgi:hypothetical protein